MSYVNDILLSEKIDKLFALIHIIHVNKKVEQSGKVDIKMYVLKHSLTEDYLYEVQSFF